MKKIKPRNRYKVMAKVMWYSLQLFIVAFYGMFSTLIRGRTPRAEITDEDAQWFFTLAQEEKEDE